MFGSDKKRHAASNNNNNIGMIIGKDTRFKGTINSQEVVRVDGLFEGDVTTVDALIVGETGRITGQFSAKSAIIAGSCEGNLDITEKLELLATARMIGDVKAGSLVVSEGAIFLGSCSMPENEALPDATAEK